MYAFVYALFCFSLEMVLSWLSGEKLKLVGAIELMPQKIRAKSKTMSNLWAKFNNMPILWRNFKKHIKFVGKFYVY